MTGTDFWSRRKAAVRAEQEAEQQAAERLAPAAEAPLDDASLLEQLGLPDPEALGPGDDFAAFMAEAVPQHLRRLALRRLWVSNPVLANLDGLVDYAEDYTDAATVIPGMQTAYEVGKGMARHVEALLAEAEEAPAAPVEAESAEEMLIPVEEEDSLPTEDAPLAAAEPDAPEMRPRHMRFEYS